MRTHVEKRLGLLQIVASGFLLVAAVMIPVLFHPETVSNKTFASILEMIPVILYALSFLICGLGIFRRTVSGFFQGIFFSNELVITITSISLVCFRIRAPACLVLLAYQVAVFVAAKIIYSQNEAGEEELPDSPDGPLPFDSSLWLPSVMQNRKLIKFMKSYVPILLILAVALVLLPTSLLGGGKTVFAVWGLRAVLALVALDPALAALVLPIAQKSCTDKKSLKRRIILIAIFCGILKLTAAVLCAIGFAGVWAAVGANALCLFAGILFAMFHRLEK